MEDLLPNLSNMLKKSIKIEEDIGTLSIKLNISNKELPPGDLAKPFEIKEMIRVFGRVDQKIPMDVDINEKSRIITIKLSNEKDFEAVGSAMKTLWDRASELLIKAFDAEPGKIEEFRELGDFMEEY